MGNKRFKLKKTNVFDYATYLFVIVVFVIVTALNSAGALNRSQQGWLVPACCYIVLAISLNLTVGIMGELSLCLLYTSHNRCSHKTCHRKLCKIPVAERFAL